MSDTLNRPDPRPTPTEPRLPLKECLALVEQAAKDMKRAMEYLEKALKQRAG